MKLKMKFIKFTIFLLGIILFVPYASAQNVVSEEEAALKEFDMNSFAQAQTKIKDSTILYQHLVGVKWGYAMSNVAFSQSGKHKGFTSTKNFGLYYTYLHSMLGNMPYFGIQFGLESTEMGYTHVTEIEENVFEEAEQRYSAIVFPLIALFRVDISKIRLMFGVGGYGSYIYDTQLPGGIPETTNKMGFGIMGQGGFAIKLHPVELHLEASYRYGFTHFVDPTIYSDLYWLYTHQNQLEISVGVHYNLGGKYYKKKK